MNRTSGNRRIARKVAIVATVLGSEERKQVSHHAPYSRNPAKTGIPLEPEISLSRKVSRTCLTWRSCVCDAEVGVLLTAIANV